MFEEKLEGETIYLIKKDNPSKIAVKAKEVLTDLKRRALAHAAIRLDYIEQGLMDAASPKPIRSVRVGEMEYEVVYGVDHAAIAKYIQLARAEEYEAKKLLLDMFKNDLVVGKESAFKPVEIDDGLVYEEETVEEEIQ